MGQGHEQAGGARTSWLQHAGRGAKQMFLQVTQGHPQHLGCTRAVRAPGPSPGVAELAVEICRAHTARMARASDNR